MRRLRVEIGLEGDGRWFADLMDLPGCLGHGVTPRAAIADALELAGDAFEVALNDDLEFDIRARGNA